MTKLRTFGRSIPSYANELAYRRRLQAEVKEMQKDVQKELKLYLESEIAMDSASMRWVQIMKALRKKWYKHFDDIGKEMTKWFMQSTDKRTKEQIRRKLKEIGWTIEPNYTDEQKELINQLAKESVSYIKSIPQKYLRGVQKAVSESIYRGGDREYLTRELYLYKRMGRCNKNAKNYAELLARDQSNKITQNYARINAQSYGCKKAKWLHVPGKYSSRHTHVEMNGKTFELERGMYDRAVGKYVFPGSLINCNCQQQFLLPGFVD